MVEKARQESLEKQRFEFEKQRFTEELKLRREELAVKEREVDNKPDNAKKSDKWTSPLAIALVGLVGVTLGAILQGYFNYKLERLKFEYTIIQKALEPTDKTEAAKNLKFLLDVGLIQTIEENKINKQLENPENLPTIKIDEAIRMWTEPSNIKQIK